MSTLLSRETEELIKNRLSRGGYRSADEMVRAALEALRWADDQRVDESEAARIRASIEQMKRGETVEWDELSAPYRQRRAAT